MKTKHVILAALLLCLIALVLSSCDLFAETSTTETDPPEVTTTFVSEISTTAEITTSEVTTTAKVTTSATTEKTTTAVITTTARVTTTAKITVATTTAKATTTRTTTSTTTPTLPGKSVDLNGAALVYPPNSEATMDACVADLISKLSSGGAKTEVSSGVNVPSGKFVYLCNVDEFYRLHGYKLALNDYCILAKNGGVTISAGGTVAFQKAIEKFAEGLAGGKYYYTTESIIFRFTPMPNNDRITEILAAYNDPNGRLMSMGHRADHQNYPENSLEAIQSCIDAGVDIVELDVMRTKDGKWILMHDSTVNRTTNGSGNVSDLTFDQIRALRLREGKGNGTPVTDIQPPSFEEVLELCSGKIIINLDKDANKAQYFDEIYKLLEKYNCVKTTQFKTSENPNVVKARFDNLRNANKEVPLYSAMIYNNDYDYVTNRIRSFAGITEMIELGYNGSNISGVNAVAKENGIRSMVLTLYAQDDATIWSNGIKQGYSCFMTEHPLDLARYIKTISYETPSTEITRASDFTDYRGVTLSNSISYDKVLHGRSLDSLSSGDWVKIPKIKFDGTENGIYIAALVNENCSVKMYTDSISNNNLIGTVNLTQSGQIGTDIYSANLSKKVTGVHDIILSFDGSGNDMAAVDFFRFFTDDGNVAAVINPYVECVKLDINLPKKVKCITSGGRIVEKSVTWSAAANYDVGKHNITGKLSDGTTVKMVLVVHDYEEIKTTAQWNEFANKVNAGDSYNGRVVVLDSDLDFSGTSFVVAGNSKDHPFEGKLIGRGHSINNINYSGSDIAGLIGYARCAEISGITLKNSTIKSSSGFVAGIIAYGDGVKVTDCHTVGCTIRSERSDNSLGGVGGLAGYLENYAGNQVEVSDCTVKNVVVYGKRDTGGFVGDLFTGNIINCHVEGTSVTATGNSIGGFAGNVHGGSLKNCHCSITVSSPGNNIGAFTGYNNGLPSYNNCTYDSAKTALSAVGKLASEIVGSITAK